MQDKIFRLGMAVAFPSGFRNFGKAGPVQDVVFCTRFDAGPSLPLWQARQDFTAPRATSISFRKLDPMGGNDNNHTVANGRVNNSITVRAPVTCSESAQLRTSGSMKPGITKVASPNSLSNFFAHVITTQVMVNVRTNCFGQLPIVFHAAAIPPGKVPKGVKNRVGIKPQRSGPSCEPKEYKDVRTQGRRRIQSVSRPGAQSGGDNGMRRRQADREGSEQETNKRQQHRCHNGGNGAKHFCLKDLPQPEDPTADRPAAETTCTGLPAP